MPKFTPEDVHRLMGEPASVRNVMTIGAMGVGKTCALDCLGTIAGMVAEDKISETRFAHTRQDEREKGCTMKAVVCSIVAEGMLMNMVDTPGHTEYSAECSTAMPLVDGALVVVNGSGGGLAAQTSQQVKEMVNWGVMPVLFCNRFDVSLLVTKKTATEIADDLFNVVDMFNSTLAQYPSPIDNPSSVSAEGGSVLFGSLANGWAFSLPQMATTYSAKFGMEVEKMSQRMWGEHYFAPKQKKWTSAGTEGAVRSFEQFVITPIMQVLKACEAGNMDKLEKMMSALGATITPADKNLTGNALFHRMMRLWMPAGPAIVNVCKTFVPDPVKAQGKRFPLLSCAPTTDESAKVVQMCSPSGPLLVQCVKLMPNPSSPGRFYAMCRAYSGTVGADKFYLLDDDYVPPHAREGLFPTADEEGQDAAAAEEGGEDEAGDEGTGSASPKSATGSQSPKSASSPKSGGGTPKAAKVQDHRIQGVQVCLGKQFTAVNNVPAGNIFAVSGVDQFFSKRATLSGSLDLFPLRKPTFSVSPVVRMSLQPVDVKELPKMVQGLQRLSKSCPLVEVALEDSGSHVVAGCGVEHMRLLRRDLESEYLPGVAVTWGAPSVAYRETVTGESTQMCLSKSPNKHNRLYVKAEPLSEEVCLAIESKQIFPTQDLKKRSKLLEKEYGWDKTDTLKIWGFGPAPEEQGAPYGANLIVDQTKGIQYLNEIRESVNSGLLWATKEGPICEENMRGIRFNLLDVKLHADSIHRGMGQIQPTARRVFFAAAMTAQARLVEPIFSASIEAPVEAQPGIMQALGSCRGELVMAEDMGQRVSVQAYVPISETIGATPFATVLSQKTNGKAFVNYKFDHWEAMAADPLQYDLKNNKALSKTAELMISIRERKGLKLAPPDLCDYLDKL